jgi:hypothetical protein
VASSLNTILVVKIRPYRLKLLKERHSEMCRKLRLVLLYVATFRICKFEITNEFTKCCALLTAQIQISDSLFC